MFTSAVRASFTFFWFCSKNLFCRNLKIALLHLLQAFDAHALWTLTTYVKQKQLTKPFFQVKAIHLPSSCFRGASFIKHSLHKHSTHLQLSPWGSPPAGLAAGGAPSDVFPIVGHTSHIHLMQVQPSGWSPACCTFFGDGWSPAWPGSLSQGEHTHVPHLQPIAWTLFMVHSGHKHSGHAQPAA